MTRGEALKDFFRKTILPVASAALLYCIFRSACVKNGELDYLWLWILCGLPFGIWRLRLWIIPSQWIRPGQYRKLSYESVPAPLPGTVLLPRRRILLLLLIRMAA